MGTKEAMENAKRNRQMGMGFTFQTLYGTGRSQSAPRTFSQPFGSKGK